MARTFKLNDLQLILLSTAAQRSDGCLLPPPDGIGVPASRIAKLIPPLLKNALVDEVEVSAVAQAWRSEGEQQFGLIINDAGRTAIGIESVASAPTPAPAPEPIAAAEPAPENVIPEPAVRTTKIGTVLDLLQREQGATLEELVTATGWLPHTTRAALTGLRKKGHTFAKTKRDEVTCYHIGEAA